MSTWLSNLSRCYSNCLRRRWWVGMKILEKYSFMSMSRQHSNIKTKICRIWHATSSACSTLRISNKMVINTWSPSLRNACWRILVCIIVCYVKLSKGRRQIGLKQPCRLQWLQPQKYKLLSWTKFSFVRTILVVFTSNCSAIKLWGTFCHF